MSLIDAVALSTRPLPPLSRLVVSLALTVTKWEMRYRTRKHLTDLPHQMLADIGLDPFSAEQEGAKPFWRA